MRPTSCDPTTASVRQVESWVFWAPARGRRSARACVRAYPTADTFWPAAPPPASTLPYMCFSSPRYVPRRRAGGLPAFAGTRNVPAYLWRAQTIRLRMGPRPVRRFEAVPPPGWHSTVLAAWSTDDSSVSRRSPARTLSEI